jgi:TIGR03009 family protein
MARHRLDWWQRANFVRFRGAGIVADDGHFDRPQSRERMKTAGGWPMARSRMILFSPLIALAAAGSARILAQEPPPGRAAQPAARAAQPAAAPAQPRAANDPAKMKWLLKAWEGQSAKLKTLDVRIYRIDKDFRWKDEVHFEGQAIFKSPDLAYLDFSKLKLAPNAQGQLAPVKDPKNPNGWVKARTETIVCNQNAVWQYLYDSKQIYIFPLAKGQRQRALDEGPLPFLFNMKAQEAEARYQMSFEGENDKYYLVKIFPKLQEDKESFKFALLYLEKTFLLPARIALVSPDGKSSRDFQLHNQKPNAQVDDKYFQGGYYKGWTVQKNPAADAPRQGNAGARPGGAGGAMRR